MLKELLFIQGFHWDTFLIILLMSSHHKHLISFNTKKNKHLHNFLNKIKGLENKTQVTVNF